MTMPVRIIYSSRGHCVCSPCAASLKCVLDKNRPVAESVRHRPLRECQTQVLLTEAETVFKRVHKPVDHQAIVIGLIQRRQPVQVENVGITSEIPKVLHDDETLVKEL